MARLACTIAALALDIMPVSAASSPANVAPAPEAIAAKVESRYAALLGWRAELGRSAAVRHGQGLRLLGLCMRAADEAEEISSEQRPAGRRGKVGRR